LPLCALALVACGRVAAPASAPAAELTKTPPPGLPSYTPWPSPTPPFPTELPELQQVLAVPASVATPDHPVIWYFTSLQRDTLIAFDWSGAEVARLHVDASGDRVITPSPDGSRFLVRGNVRIEKTAVVGRVVDGQAVWAQDDEHLCAWRPTDGRPRSSTGPMSPMVPATLWVDDTAGGARRLLDYGSWGPHSQPETLACNAPANVAVVASDVVASLSNPRAVRFADGASITWRAPTGPIQDLVASPDGHYAAFGDSVHRWSGHGFDVIDTSTGAVLTHIDGSGIVSFSDDDTRALVVVSPNNSDQAGRWSVIDWRTGRVLSSRLAAWGTVMTRPHSSDFLLGDAHKIVRPGVRYDYPLEDPIILRGDGTVLQVGSSLDPLSD
jgi:hypothetical protein